jgi:hypothetical protein
LVGRHFLLDYTVDRREHVIDIAAEDFTQKATVGQQHAVRGQLVMDERFQMTL